MVKRKASNNIEVKRINRNRVFRYIRRQGTTSRPEIAEALGMSGPTVMQMVNELQALGVVQEAGELESTGGRKAKAIAAVPDAYFAVGIDITRNHVGILATNLSEQMLRHERIHKPFVCEEAYFRELGEIYREFLEKTGIPSEKILGVGISVPGIVDCRRNRLLHSHLLQISDLDATVFQKYLPHPCTLINDANAAGSTEERAREEDYNLLYLSLSNSVGGAIIVKKGTDAPDDGELLPHLYIGDHWRSGEFGHMILHPGGARCYCGKKGCLDVYCSALSLAELGGGKLERFFEKVEAGDAVCTARWETYQQDLAAAVENLHMAFDCDVVLGGYVGSYMEPYLRAFRRRIAAENIFGDGGDYVKVCSYRVEASAFGAALHYIDSYVRGL